LCLLNESEILAAGNANAHVSGLQTSQQGCDFIDRLGSYACQAERLILGEAGEAAAPGDVDNGSRRELDFSHS